MFAALDFSWFKQMDVEAQLPAGAVLMVVDHKGTILVRYPDTKKWTGRTIPEHAIVEAALSSQGENIVETRGIDGALRLHGVATVRGAPGAELYVSIGISKEAAFASADRVFARNLLGLGSASVLALLAAWLGGETFILRRVSILVDATKRLAGGDLSVRIGPQQQRDELSLLAGAFDEMAESLETRSTQLYQTEVKYRTLAAHIEAVREEERTRISREIHDELGQSLTGLKMDLSWLDRKLSDPKHKVSLRLLHEKIESMKDLVDATVQSVRKISTELRPGILDDLGLTAAIEWQASDFQSRTGIACRFESLPEDVSLDEKSSSAVFRIFQEILTNVARHAEATQVDIDLKEEAGKLILEVRDNGRGITERESGNAKSLGLLGMRERAFLLGGEFHISGVPTHGTTVRV